MIAWRARAHKTRVHLIGCMPGYLQNKGVLIKKCREQWDKRD